MLPFGYTLDEFIAGVSHIRNNVIARVFRELKLMEEWGTGYKRIIDACNTGGYPSPIWEELGTSIRVKFGPHEVTQEKQMPSTDKNKLTLRQKKILQLLDPAEPRTAKAIHSGLDEKISERTFRNELLVLRDQGFIKMIGSGRNSAWIHVK